MHRLSAGCGAGTWRNDCGTLWGLDETTCQRDKNPHHMQHQIPLGFLWVTRSHESYDGEMSGEYVLAKGQRHNGIVVLFGVLVPT